MTAACTLVHSLHLQQGMTLDRIDHALDTGDRWAFNAWCKRRASLTHRLEGLLHTLATED